MLISSAFRSVAVSQAATRKQGKASAVKRMAGSNINEVEAVRATHLLP